MTHLWRTEESHHNARKKLGNDVRVLSCVIVCEIRNVNVNVYCVSVSVCEMICCSMTVMWFVKC